jgi:DNA-directed RNA polymerase subunit RPC12/RpoP
MAELPLIDATGLTRGQRAGRACVCCGKRFPRPSVPVGRLATGEVLYRCPECSVVLEPAEPGRARVLTNRSDSERRA